MLVLASLALLAMILPNALHIPQQNPSPVLEYAPVPPTDEAPPSSEGNMNSLALGSSSTVSSGVEDPPPPPPPPGQGKRPATKRCVGKPPRQTEDLMAPPCVPFFDGDNFGETWQGVSKDEIRVLVYLDRGCPNNECSPKEKTYHDLSAPAKPPCPKTWPADNPDADKCDYIWFRVARGLNAYFNNRFQTYNRKVRYFAYISNARTPGARRADAGDNFATIRPFAVIDYATYFGNNEAYDQAMAARGVLVFSSRTALPNAYFRTSPTFAWGFWPDAEHWAALYGEYVCNKVAPFPVYRGGSPPGSWSKVGSRRRFGLFYTEDRDEPGLRLFASLVKRRLRSCGVSWVAEATYPSSGYGVERGDDGSKQLEAVSRFIANDVTTVLYLGGIEGKFSQMADGRAYYPEIVLAGDLENDNNQAGRIQNQKVWANAWAMHLQLRMDGADETIGAQAYREGSPSAPQEDSRFANEAYRDHFMLFQAIQVAGPRLRPDTVDKGFHAIPPKESTNPYVASCYFDPGDFTCVKDATQVWWDPTGTSPGDGIRGCWRLVREGRRSIARSWSRSDDVFRDTRQPCTGYDSRFQINPN